MNLRSQFLISDITGVYNTLKRVYEDMGIVSVVIPPFKFLNILIHVLNAHHVEGSGNRTLKQAPNAFNSVSVNITHNPFLFRMVDSFKTGIVVGNADIRFEFIRVYSFGFVLYRSSDKVMDGFFPDVRDFLNTDFTATLDSTRNPCDRTPLFVPIIK